MQRLTGTCLVGAFLTLAALPCIAEEARAGSSEEQAIRAVVLDYVDGCSTSSLIESIRGS